MVLVLVLHSVSLMCWAHGFSVLQCLVKVPPSYIYSHVACLIAMVKPVLYASVKTKHSYNTNGQYLVTSTVVFVCVCLAVASLRYGCVEPHTHIT